MLEGAAVEWDTAIALAGTLLLEVAAAGPPCGLLVGPEALALVQAMAVVEAGLLPASFELVSVLAASWLALVALGIGWRYGLHLLWLVECLTLLSVGV